MWCAGVQPFDHLHSLDGDVRGAERTLALPGCRTCTSWSHSSPHVPRPHLIDRRDQMGDAAEQNDRSDTSIDAFPLKSIYILFSNVMQNIMNMNHIQKVV